MAARWLRSLVPLACACVLVAGCGDVDPAPQGQPASPESPTTPAQDGSAPAAPTVPEDAVSLLDRALGARAANAPGEFAALVSAASQACPDPDAARRLGEVAAIAARWSSAVLESRPKAQAVTEAQLTAVDWDALAAACVGA